ncbi:dynein light intermediate chain-domain-containing protein [Dichotomocladium elegans]|nr:dynein light intermediate chain-domain-containing protein [Dichotomocladium elegans]
MTVSPTSGLMVGTDIPAHIRSTATTATPGTSTQAIGPEKDEIWSGILKGVASSKMIPTKNVLVLGDPSCGKSTLIHYLKHDPGPLGAQPENDDVPTKASFGVTPGNYTHVPVDRLDEDVTNTLALGYTFADIKDEENEGIVRLGMYQLGLSAPEYLPLLKFALSADTLADSLVIIAIDWTRPWKFLDSFQRWINVIQRMIDEICKEGSAGESWSRGKAVVDELRERVEHTVQSYTEPSTNSANAFTVTAPTSTGSVPSTPVVSTPLVTTTTSADQITLPLPQGCLTTNLGVPIILVCCKSDALNMLEQKHDYKEEQFDYIQQTLRCICMKYGAALFYTSTLHPYTFHNLRQYILHRLLTTHSKAFPFTLKAQVIERDSVMVPTGWDTWGKIRVLREGFDCEYVHQGWDADLESIMDRQEPGPHGARGEYEEAIPDPEIEEQPLNTSPPVTCEDEQVFFERHHETLRPVRKPEGTSRTRAGGTVMRPSVIGPIDVANTATIDVVEDNDATARPLRQNDPILDRQGLEVKHHLGRELPAFAHVDPIQTVVDPMGSTAGGAPNFPGGADGASSQAIADFFQSLLLRRPAPGTSPATVTSGTSIATATSGESNTRRLNVSRREVHRELDRMRQSVNNP